MARWTHVVIALLGMTGLALAQSPAQPYPAPPPQPYPPQPYPAPPPQSEPAQPYPAPPPQPDPAQPAPAQPPPAQPPPPRPYRAQPSPPDPDQPPPPHATGPATLEGAGPTTRSKLGGDLAFVLPFGRYADGNFAALGIFGRYEKALGPQAFTTLRLGFLHHLVRDNQDADISFLMIPFFFGARYNFSPTGQGLFLLSEGGINFIRSSISIPDLQIEDSSTSIKFTANLGVGVQTGTFSARGTLFVTTRAGTDTEGNSTSLFGMMVSIGVDFAAL